MSDLPISITVTVYGQYQVAKAASLTDWRIAQTPYESYSQTLCEP